MKKTWVFWVAVFLVSGVAFSRQATDQSAELHKLVQADRDFNDATAARGLDGFRAFLAENAGTLRADRPVIVGRDALAETWKPLLSNPALAIHWGPLSGSLSSGGDMGYTVGTYEITKTDEKGKRVVATGKYVTIWRKQLDGSWKVEFDSGVPDSDPAEKKN